jgi:hypothetical protein
VISVGLAEDGVEEVFLASGYRIIHEVLENFQGVRVNFIDFGWAEMAVASSLFEAVEDVASLRENRHYPCKLDLHELAVVLKQVVVQQSFGVNPLD